MTDRLAELGILPAWAQEEDDLSSKNSEPEAVYHAMEDEEDNDSRKKKSKKQEGEDTNPIMKTYFQDVEVVKKDINEIITCTKEITRLNEKLWSATTQEEEEALGKKLKIFINNGNKCARQSKNILALLKEETSRFKSEKKLNASDIRVRENLCNTLTRKYIDEMKGYQKAQHSYKNDLKKKAKRQIKTIKPDVTNEEVEKIMKSGRQTYLKEKILIGGVSEEIKNKYQQVSSKYKDVLTIEASVAELHQMFLDVALLTEQQGELLDQISFNVQNAVDHVDSANEETKKAILYQQEARKRQMIIMAIVAFCIGLLCFMLFR